MIATADVHFYDVVLFFHILSVVLAFGPSFAYGMFVTIAQRDGGVAVPSVGRAILTWDRTIGTASMVIVFLSGMYMASKDTYPWDFSDFFVSWGFVAIIVLFGLVHGFFIPNTRKAVELAERDLGDGGKLSAEFEARSALLGKIGPIAGLIVVLTIYVMTAKPFL
jgi:predicted integral membrane protein DUF2269